MQNSSSSSANPSGVQGICPTGWHVPSDAEWTQLTNYVGSQTQYRCGSNSSYIAKALASTTGWSSYSATCAVGNNLGTNNATGFSALPAGNYYGDFGNFGYGAYFWSATEINGSKAYSCYLGYNYDYVSGGESSKSYGFSVRCVRNVALNLSSTAINNKVYIGATPVSVTYTATPENGTDGYTFIWENEDGIVAADGNSYTTTYSTLGVHTVTCTATGYGISLSKTITIDVLSVEDEND